MSYKKLKYGFTLIEILIVMTLIALLAGISLFGLQGARESARDAQRKGDLQAIRSALEFYRSDCGAYPDVSAGDFESRVGSPFTSGDGSCPATISPARTYLTDVPTDPTGGSYHYNRTSAYTYELCTTLEEAPASPESCSGNIGNFRVTNP